MVMKNKRPIQQEAAVQIAFGLSSRCPIRTTMGTMPTRTNAYYDVHFELEVGVVTQGSVRRLYPDGSFHDYGVGEIWFHGMWEPHGWTALKPETQRLVVMVWPPFILDLCFPEAADLHWLAPFVVEPKHRPMVPPTLQAEVLRIAYALGTAAEASAADKRPQSNSSCKEPLPNTREQPPTQNGESATRERNVLLTHLLFLQLLTVVLTDPINRHLRSCPTPIPSQHLSPALMLVFSSHEHIPVKKAADACGIATGAFSQKFQQAMGCTFGQFALRRRLSCAANQLISTDYKVKRIALEWGFSDESHFCRSFEQTYRCTPSEYRCAKLREI